MNSIVLLYRNYTQERRFFGSCKLNRRRTIEILLLYFLLHSFRAAHNRQKKKHTPPFFSLILAIFPFRLERGFDFCFFKKTGCFAVERSDFLLLILSQPLKEYFSMRFNALEYLLHFFFLPLSFFPLFLVDILIRFFLSTFFSCCCSAVLFFSQFFSS